MHIHYLLPLLVFTFFSPTTANPTDGFSAVPLSNSSFEVQIPYDKLPSERYSFINGVHKFWVYKNDKPFKRGSDTLPRTEIRVKGYDYSSGVWQFEGQVYIPSGTNGTSVMQIHRSDNGTAMMLRVYNGNLSNYIGSIVQSDAYNRWITVNVIHEVQANRITIYIDGAQVLPVNARGSGPATFDFKFGVYAQDGSSSCMESRWKGVRILRK